MSAIGDSARCECGKTNHLAENCPTLSEHERKMCRLHNLHFVEYLRRKLLSRCSTEYTTESVIDREVQYVEGKVDSEINTYVLNARNLSDPRPFTARKYSIYKYFRQYRMEYSSI